jgi:hypothetical protein
MHRGEEGVKETEQQGRKRRRRRKALKTSRLVRPLQRRMLCDLPLVSGDRRLVPSLFRPDDARKGRKEAHAFVREEECTSLTFGSGEVGSFSLNASQ